MWPLSNFAFINFHSGVPWFPKLLAMTVADDNLTQDLFT